MSDSSFKMLADSLWVLRKYSGMTQARLASELGVSQSYLSEVEKGDKDVTLNLIERYSEVFGVPMSAILLFAESEGSRISEFKSKKRIASATLAVLKSLLPREAVNE
jgi:transcriptional regulator with XRE-family HTH domain